MVAAAPKRGDQLTLWDDEFEEASGTAAATPQPAPVPRRRPKRSRAGQLTLDTIDLSLPDPEAWLEGLGGLNVPQSCVDAMGEQFRADMERTRSSTGRVFEDKDGWHLLGAWIVKNEKGVWAVAHKIVRANLSGDAEEVFSDLCAACMSWAKWVRPWVERNGQKKGAKFLTAVQTFGVRKFVKAKPYQVLAGQFCEDYQEEAVAAKEFRTGFEAADELRLAMSKMTAQERKAVRLALIEGVPLKRCAARLGLRRARGVERLIQSAFERARAALVPEGGGG